MLSKYSILGDIWRLRVPVKEKPRYAFCFLVHPRSYRDIWVRFPLLKFLPRSISSLILFLMPPLTISEVQGLKSRVDGATIPGWIIALPMHPSLMLKHRSWTLRKIKQGVRLAENRGAKILGLGGLISSLSQGGLQIKEGASLHITTGHALTAHIVTKNVIELTKYMEESAENVTVAIVGAAGSIGSTSAKILADGGYKNFLLVDLDRKMDKVEELGKDLAESGCNVQLSTDVKAISTADYIITATNAPGTLVTKESLSKGSIIVDDAQPSDVHPDVLKDNDYLVVSGGVVHLPNISTKFKMGLVSKNDNYSCMGELLCLSAVEHNDDYVIARATTEDVYRISKTFESLGYTLADYQNNAGSISSEHLDHIKRIRIEA